MTVSAILELWDRLDFTMTLKPICMPHWSSKDYKNDEGRIAGWGWDGQAWPVKLKRSKRLEIQSVEDCKASMDQKWGTQKWHTVTKYIDTTLNHQNTCINFLRSDVCTHGTVGMANGQSRGNPCKGDYGTSLMVKENRRSDTLFLFIGGIDNR